MDIDWTNAAAQVTEHFTVGDCLTLHSWNRLANETDGVTDDIKSSITTLCQKMEEIRTVLGCPMNAHCIYRSPDYNAQVVGAIPHDVHSMGMAIGCNAQATNGEGRRVVTDGRLHQPADRVQLGLTRKV